MQQVFIETCFMTEVPDNNQWKEHNLFCKVVLGLFKIALSLRDWHPNFKRFFLPSSAKRQPYLTNPSTVF